MANLRRSSDHRRSDRRRRVLYSTHQADANPSTAASRREAERLREARRPPAAYGVRVQRRLQGRWFSLVPVQLRTMLTVSGGLIGCTLLLCVLHYAAVSWPAIAYRPEIARPLRLDRPDSFGSWYSCVLLTGSAAIALLIYQLRRYRIDDYQGRYRLWRLVLIVLLLASVNALVSLIPWSGAVLDAAFGRRVALSGGDWIRLVASIGGIILALRLAAEIRRCRWALATLILATALWAVPEAAKWKFLSIDSLSMWTLVTTAPLLALTSLFVSLGSYLRMLYREVQEIEEGESLVQRLGQVRLRLFRRDRDEEDARDAEAKEIADAEEAESRQRSSDREPSKTTTDAKPAAKRRWFGLRAARSSDSERVETSGKSRQGAVSKKDESNSKPRKKRRWFSLRLDPAARIEKAAKSQQSPQRGRGDQAAAPAPTDKPKPDQEKKSRSGLKGWFSGKSASENQPPAPQTPAPSKPSSSPTSDEDELDPDNIDWDSMSKSERRRLRKKLRRQGRAA